MGKEENEENAKQVSHLRIQRGVTKGQQTKLKTYIEEKAASANVFELETKLGMLETYCTNFNRIQTELECIDNTEASSNEREKYEDNYFKIKATLLRLINIHKPRDSVTLNTATLETTLHQTRASENIEKLKLPNFSGELTEWLDIWSVFQALVHDNNKYTDAEKFQHLRNCLVGNAKQIVKGMDNTAKNYNEAIKLLKTRYDNKRYVFQAHISSIFVLQVISKPSVEHLRCMIDRMEAHIRSLLAIGKKDQIADGLMLHIFTSRLDLATQARWEEEVSKKAEQSADSSFIFPTWEEFSDFLEKRLQSLKFLQTSKDQSHSSHMPYKPQSGQSKLKQRFGEPTIAFISSSTSSSLCVFCSQAEHSPFRCQKLQNLSPSARFDETKRLKLCINCLKGGHSVKFCKSNNKCQKCAGNHHTLLHIYPTNLATHLKGNEAHSSSVQAQASTGNNSLELSQYNSVALVTSSPANENKNRITYSCKNIVLPTALVSALDRNNSHIPCRALLDSASQSNFISESFAKRLGLTIAPTDAPIFGIGNVDTLAKYKTVITIKSRLNNFSANLTALILPSITGNQPNYNLQTSNIYIPTNINLADPCFHEPKPIDLLIGAELFFSLLCVGQIKTEPASPVLQKTVFGWIISGNISEPTQYSFCSTVDTNAPENINYSNCSGKLKTSHQPHPTLTSTLKN